MSANAGRVISIPTVTPKIVVNAKPLNKPAPAQNKGSMAATIVIKAPKIINNALLTLDLIEESFDFDTDSSNIII